VNAQFCLLAQLALEPIFDHLVASLEVCGGRERHSPQPSRFISDAVDMALTVSGAGPWAVCQALQMWLRAMIQRLKD
jgi:hypothetical protein